MFISALRHAVRDKPGKYHPDMLRRSTAATSVMRCDSGRAGRCWKRYLTSSIYSLRICVLAHAACRHNSYLQVAQIVAGSMLYDVSVFVHFATILDINKNLSRWAVGEEFRRLFDCCMSNCTMLIGSTMVENRIGNIRVHIIQCTDV